MTDKENILLEAVKMAYRKHHLGDDSIGWEELSNILCNAICNTIGNESYCQWVDSLEGVSHERENNMTVVCPHCGSHCCQKRGRKHYCPRCKREF